MGSNWVRLVAAPPLRNHIVLGQLKRKFGTAVVVLTLVFCAAPLALAQSPWKVSASAAVKEGWDENVFLQDQGALGNRGSTVSNIATNVGATYANKGEWDTKLDLGLAPQYTWYCQQTSEDYFNLGGSLDLVAKAKDWSINTKNLVTFIEGDDKGLIFTGPGGAPVTGGIPIRDRRDATIYRSTFSVAWTPGPWLVRPVFSGYLHDFRTKHSATPGYQNYVDRDELMVGFDVGYQVIPNTHLIAGYRFGLQRQAELLGNPLEYSNHFHRVVVGIEGKPLDWMKLAVMGGPDFRDFGKDTAPGFDDEQTRWFVDALITLTFSPNDELVFSARRFTQPGFGGRSVYDDATYRASYKRQLTKDWSAQATVQAYNTDFFSPAPVGRDDWIYTLGLSAAWRFTPNLSAEAGWSYDLGESDVPATSGREFHRNWVWIGLKAAM